MVKDNQTRANNRESSDAVSAVRSKKGVVSWRALYVNSRAEKKVRDGLLGVGIETYLPLVKSVRQWSDRKKAVELPLLNGYIFVHIGDADMDQVLRVRGVVNFVRCEGRIAQVRNEEIERLRQ